jgi:hypothetical protein
MIIKIEIKFEIDSNEWIVKVKGWALSHKTSSAKQKMMMSKRGNTYALYK